MSALRAGELLDALSGARDVVEDHAPALDRLDRGDAEADRSGVVAAGSDLAATLTAACARADGRRDLASLGSELAQGASEGARGRTGRRVAAWFSGAAEVLRTYDRLDGPTLALVLEAGAEKLTEGADAVRPGCLASVTAAAADAALVAGDSGATLPEVLIAAADAGLAELERGPVDDERLASRGTVDAGAAGFLLVLDSLAASVTGEPLPTPPPEEPHPARVDAVREFVVSGWVEPEEDCGPDEALHLRSVWEELGHVERFEQEPRRWPFRLRTPRPGAALESLCDVGRPRELFVDVVDDGADLSTGSTSTDRSGRVAAS